MTSTVLDVTVLLLCVSASVVALGAAGDGIGREGPTADDAADRLVTETVTVTYQAPAAPNDTRTVHWTRAELLAAIATERKSDGDGTVGGERFESDARSTIADGLGPRTQITAHTPLTTTDTEIGGNRDRANDESPESRTSPETDFTANQPRATPEETHPSEDSTSTADTGEQPWWGSDTDGTPWWLDGTKEAPWDSEAEADPAMQSEPLSEPQSDSKEAQEPVSIGGEPPRTADVTTAVVTQPTPSESKTTGPVTIVIRRW